MLIVSINVQTFVSDKDDEPWLGQIDADFDGYALFSFNVSLLDFIALKTVQMFEFASKEELCWVQKLQPQTSNILSCVIEEARVASI